MRNIHKGQGLTFLLHMHGYDEKTILLEKFDILLEYQGRFFTGDFFMQDNLDKSLTFPYSCNGIRDEQFNFVSSEKDVDYKKLNSISTEITCQTTQKDYSFGQLSNEQLYQAFSKFLDAWEKENDIELSYPPYIYNLKEYGSDKPAISFVDAADLDFNIVGLLEI